MKYKVNEEFELNGSKHEVGAEVELSESEAAELGEKVSKVEDAGADQTPPTPPAGDNAGGDNPPAGETPPAGGEAPAGGDTPA